MKQSLCCVYSWFANVGFCLIRHDAACSPIAQSALTWLYSLLSDCLLVHDSVLVLRPQSVHIYSALSPDVSPMCSIGNQCKSAKKVHRIELFYVHDLTYRLSARVTICTDTKSSTLSAFATRHYVTWSTSMSTPFCLERRALRKHLR